VAIPVQADLVALVRNHSTLFGKSEGSCYS
jgi:hypothetical protein